MCMSVIDQRPAGDALNDAGISPAVVIAADRTIKSRIATTLSAQGVPVEIEVDTPTEIGEHELDSETIIVFACDIDVPQEVTSLRRLCRETQGPSVVVVSPPATGAGVRRTLDAGADALVFEPELELTLAATIRAVASGQSVVPRKLRASVEKPTLSHREHQVIALVRQGLTNAEIAERLFLAESTIKSHLASIFTKFGVHSRKEATAVFIDLERSSVEAPLSSTPLGSPEQATA